MSTEKKSELLSRAEALAVETRCLAESLSLEAPKPFMWGMMNRDGNPHFDECCVGDEATVRDAVSTFNAFALEAAADEDSAEDLIAVPLYRGHLPEGFILVPPLRFEQDPQDAAITRIFRGKGELGMIYKISEIDRAPLFCLSLRDHNYGDAPPLKSMAAAHAAARRFLENFE